MVLIRDNDSLPQGALVLAFPDAFYNVPGLFQFAKLVYLYLDYAKSKFGIHIPIKYLYGAPSVKWNSGRLVLNQSATSLGKIEEEICEATSKGIIPLVTFSNPLLSETDLEDPLCNDILELLDREHGGVIISSKTLFDHVHKHYPKLRIHASVIMCAFERNRDAAYYQNLASQCEHYVVHPDDLFNIELLKNIPKENGELLANERCFRNCPIRTGHYKSISREQLSRSQGIILDERFLDHCKAIPEHKQLNSNCRNLSFSISEIRQLLDLGFKNIKIQGRTDSLFVVFFELMRYTLESEIAFPSMFTAFSYTIQDYLKGAIQLGRN